MKVKTLEQAKELAYKHLGVTNLEESKILIDDRYIRDFEWGAIFTYNSRIVLDGTELTEIESVENQLCGNLPVLVDKYDGSTQNVGGVTHILDVQLEEYRESKGYPHCIKFPLKESLEGKSSIEQVRLLFGSGEYFKSNRVCQLQKRRNCLT